MPASPSLTGSASDNPAIGLTAVVPVGMSEASSCVIRPDLTPGQHIAKGDELGQFQFGGSTHCLVFRPGVIADFALPAIPQPHDPGLPRVLARSKLATARTGFACPRRPRGCHKASGPVMYQPMPGGKRAEATGTTQREAPRNVHVSCYDEQPDQRVSDTEVTDIRSTARNVRCLVGRVATRPGSPLPPGREPPKPDRSAQARCGGSARPVRGQASTAGPIPGTFPRVPDLITGGRAEIITGTPGATTVPQSVIAKGEHFKDHAACPAQGTGCAYGCGVR